MKIIIVYAVFTACLLLMSAMLIEAMHLDQLLAKVLA